MCSRAFEINLVMRLMLGKITLRPSSSLVIASTRTFVGSLLTDNFVSDPSPKVLL